MACVDYTGAKILNLYMTTADGRDKIVDGPVSFQELRRLMFRSLSLPDLFENFNVFKSPPNDKAYFYKKHEFCGDHGEKTNVYIYNVNANEAMRDLSKSMPLNFGTNFVLDIRLKNGRLVNVSHDVTKLWFSTQTPRMGEVVA
tara:strand:- start:42 stop:470 length:429 start_codon:yes stop_codon:yes gene_type:complete